MATAKNKPKQLVLEGMPNEKQKEFFLARQAHIAYGGARYGGKSWAMRRKCVLLCLKYPGIQILLLRRTLPELKENHLVPLLAELDGVAKYNADMKSFMFPRNSRLKLGYCDTDADVIQYQGQSYDVVCFEEATNFTEFQWNQIRLCCRTSETIKAKFRPRRYYTANPGGVGHEWFKRIFIDRDFREGENPEDYIFIPALIYDNTVVMQRNPEYLNELKSLPDDLREAYLNGNWNVFAGMFFKEFKPEIHVVPPFEIPPYWKRIRSLDYGLDMTACIWWAVSNNGQVFAYRELHEPGLNLTKAAEKIVNMTPDDEHISYTTASPDLWSRRQETGASGVEIMSRAGLKGLVKANHKRIAGWRAMREYLEPFEIKDDKGNVTKTARMQIFSNCKNFIKYLPMLQHDEHNPEDAADKPHIVSHICESARYFCMSRHPESSIEGKLTFPKGATEEEKERIRNNLQFEKVYRTMPGHMQRSSFGGW